MDNSFNFRHIYPNMRYFMGSGRFFYGKYKAMQSRFQTRHTDSKIIPDSYHVCNTTTIDSDLTLHLLEGNLPQDINGNLYICQCLGTPGAFMVGDTNLIKMNFDQERVTLKNRFMWNPVAIARLALQKTKYRFDYFGLMFLSPGLGMFSYTEGMYLLPDGRLGITSDVDRPWIVDRENLRVETALGKKDEWIPMMSGDAGDAMGKLFSGYSNSHVIYTDTETNELFLASHQAEQSDGSHQCQLMKWDGFHDLKKWTVMAEDGTQVRIMQSIHELVFTRDYIILADTAFVAGLEMLTPWKCAPLPNKVTVAYIIDRRNLSEDTDTVTAKRIEVGEACIHLIPEYENPDDVISLYMLHTPATNTAEIIKDYDRDMYGKLFSKHIVGYGTLPVLDLSSIGKHTIDMKSCKVTNTKYLTDEKYCFGPYMYTYMGRQTRKFQDQDLFVMSKGFSKDMLPKRIYEAYKDVENRRLSAEKMFDGKGLQHNNAISRIKKDEFEIVDGYVFPDKIYLYTISCLESNDNNHAGYVIAGIAHDIPENNLSSGHEYWIFKADELAKGPVCKLGNKELNNSILFHTVYISDTLEEKLNQIKPTYQIPMQEDYPRDGLHLWEDDISNTFDELIYPYYDKAVIEKREHAEKKLRELTKNRIPSPYGKEHLIEEVNIADAPTHAKKMIDEANRMFQTTGWKFESNRNGVLVESKAVSGVFESANVFVTRASGMIQAEASKFFQFMVSPKGYAIIDPVSDPDDHEKAPLEVYQWKEGCRLEAALASTNIPGLPPTDFVVLNAIDPEEMIFASKSILHDSMPGGSRYSGMDKPENGHERAINTFVIKIEPIDSQTCRVLCINYADMCGKTSAGINNFINKKAFFPPLYKRMHKALNDMK